MGIEGGISMRIRKEELKRIVIHSLKIGLGSCIAILIAEQLDLQFASSAGIITLLSTVNTKWDTVKLSLIRLVTFAITIVLTFCICHFIRSDWFAFGIFMFTIFALCIFMNWKDTVSVNAVAATHFIVTQDFSVASIRNEFLLVMIGVAVAVFFNLFNDYKSQKKRLILDMQYIELATQDILAEIAGYLQHETMGQYLLGDIKSLEDYLTGALKRARDYQNNTFVSHPGYYIEYIVMRFKQCNILYNLHDELKKMRQMPIQAEIVAGYIIYLKQYVKEHNEPEKQFAELYNIIEKMKHEPPPAVWEEFEGRAILYHVLMDLEDFLNHKKNFIASLSETQRAIYWKEF